MTNDTEARCESVSVDGRRCQGGEGHAGEHWAGAFGDAPRVGFRVDFRRHGYDDSVIFDTRSDAEAFVNWGQVNGSAFIRAEISEVSR